MTESLNTHVARALGITAIESVRAWAEDPEAGPYELDYQRGTYPDGHESRLPDWAHDANAALSLPLPDGFCLRWTHDGQWEASSLLNTGKDPAFEATADTPAEAICTAFVEWKRQERIADRTRLANYLLAHAEDAE